MKYIFLTIALFLVTTISTASPSEIVAQSSQKSEYNSHQTNDVLLTGSLFESKRVHQQNSHVENVITSVFTLDHVKPEDSGSYGYTKSNDFNGSSPAEIAVSVAPQKYTVVCGWMLYTFLLFLVIATIGCVLIFWRKHKERQLLKAEQRLRLANNLGIQERYLHLSEVIGGAGNVYNTGPPHKSINH